MHLPEFEKLSKVDLIHLRNGCEQELQRRHYQVPEIKEKNKSSIVDGHLFGEQYYMDRIKKNDYSKDQLLLMRQKARENGWGKLLQLTDMDMDMDMDKKVSATSFLEMMEMKANEL